MASACACQGGTRLRPFVHVPALRRLSSRRDAE